MALVIDLQLDRAASQCKCVCQLTNNTRLQVRICKLAPCFNSNDPPSVMPPSASRNIYDSPSLVPSLSPALLPFCPEISSVTFFSGGLPFLFHYSITGAMWGTACNSPCGQIILYLRAASHPSSPASNIQMAV